MSNAKRPSTARKVTPKDEAARKAVLDTDVSVRVDGTVYTIKPADLSGLVEMRIRRETGMPILEIIDKLQTSPGIDVLGCFMFACEVAGGLDADLNKILGSISYASDVDIRDVEPEGDPVPQP